MGSSRSLYIVLACLIASLPGCGDDASPTEPASDAIGAVADGAKDVASEQAPTDAGPQAGVDTEEDASPPEDVAVTPDDAETVADISENQDLFTRVAKRLSGLDAAWTHPKMVFRKRCKAREL